MYLLLRAVAIVLYCAHSSSSSTFFGRKTWWSKEITSDFYTAGRLTETQLKYATEAGFKTVVSLFYHEKPDTVGSEVLPTSRRSAYIVEHLAGGTFYQLLGPGADDDVASIETVRAFTEVALEAEKPLLTYCQTAKSATFIVLAYLANQTLHNPRGFEPRIDSRALYERAAGLGFEYPGADYRRLVATLTGEPIVKYPLSGGTDAPPPSIPDWNTKYWLMKPVYANWYIAGQVQTNYLPRIADAGFDAMVNIRKAVTDGPEQTRSQEEVSLLNVADGTGTYVGTGRQSTERLLETRLDAGKSNRYISQESIVNYAARNELEFGDDIGYNETTESTHAQYMQWQYYLTPIGGEYGYDMEMFDAYIETWLDAGAHEHVLVHCASAYRAAVAGLLGAGYQYGLDCHWAVKRAKQLGYHFDEEEDQAIVKLFHQALCP